jgi:hypothetical protein
MQRLHYLSCILIGSACHGFAAEPSLDYNRDIRPILSENCFACHGFDVKSRQADLRLDTAEGAFAKRDDGPAIVPGNASQSLIWNRIVSTDEDTLMPPPSSNHVLTEAQRAKIKTWIEQGAAFAGHWSFIPPNLPVLDASASDNPIDALIQKRLKEEGLVHSAPADKSTLIRRVYFDLIGMPPSSEEVKAFVNDTTVDAYHKVIDRLLQSDHFGERMALEWLDAARYSDTNGFSIDGGRHLWLWRDWVIQAFNDNLPYDRFLVEQLAGDLLPNRTDSQLIATGFQRNNMVTHEGGTIPEENITNYNADRVKTLGESILGLTLGCAQCHDHKYDPISQREYYQMFAFFNSLGDKGLDGNGGVNPGPSVKLKTVLRTGKEEQQLRSDIQRVEGQMQVQDQDILRAWYDRERSKLAMRGKDLKTHPLKLLKISTPNRGNGFEIEEGRVRLKEPGNMGAFDISAEVKDVHEPISGIRIVVHPVPELPGGGWGKGPSDKVKAKPKPKSESNDESDTTEAVKGTFMLTSVSVTFDKVPSDQVNLFKLTPIASVTANTWEAGKEPIGCLDPRNESGWSPDLTTEGLVRLTASFSHPIQPEDGSYVTAQLNFGHG